MSALRIAGTNLIDTATLATTGAGGMALPLANLQNSRRARPARTLTSEDWTIKADFGATASVSDIVLWRHNFTASTTWRLRCYAGANQTGTLVYDTADVSFPGDANPSWGYLWAALAFDSVSARSLRLDISGSGLSYWELNRLFVGNALVFDTPQDWGSVVAWRTDAQVQHTEGGSILVPVRPGWRELTMSLSFLTPDERAAVLAMARNNLVHDLWISAYTGVGGVTERDYSMLGRLVGADGNNARLPNLWGDRLVVQEI